MKNVALFLNNLGQHCATCQLMQWQTSQMQRVAKLFDTETVSYSKLLKKRYFQTQTLKFFKLLGFNIFIL